MIFMLHGICPPISQLIIYHILILSYITHRGPHFVMSILHDIDSRLKKNFIHTIYMQLMYIGKKYE